MQLGITDKDIKEQEHPSEFRDNYSMNNNEMVKRKIGIKPRSYIEDPNIIKSRNQKIKEVEDISLYANDKNSNILVVKVASVASVGLKHL